MLLRSLHGLREKSVEWLYKSREPERKLMKKEGPKYLAALMLQPEHCKTRVAAFGSNCRRQTDLWFLLWPYRQFGVRFWVNILEHVNNYIAILKSLPRSVARWINSDKTVLEVKIQSRHFFYKSRLARGSERFVF